MHRVDVFGLFPRCIQQVRVRLASNAVQGSSSSLIIQEIVRCEAAGGAFCMNEGAGRVTQSTRPCLPLVTIGFDDLFISCDIDRLFISLSLSFMQMDMKMKPYVETSTTGQYSSP